MQTPPTSRFAALVASLFAKPTPNYALGAMLLLVMGGTVVYGSNLAPGVITHVVMLLTMLGSSRLFNTGLLRPFWSLTVGLIALVLVLDVAVCMVA